MKNLRAEDVKEALDVIETASSEVIEGQAGVFLAAPSLDQVLLVWEAAHAWLASQEQTPNYEAAAKQWYASLMWSDQYRSWEELPAEGQASYVHRATRAVDAALVGFHPQPTEER